MASNKKLPDFPDVEAKLQKPSKQSAFEKQKADAEAKRKREAEETAAVYESFVKSFDNDDDNDQGNSRHGASGHRGPPRLPGTGAPLARPGAPPAFGAAGPSRRHFGSGPAAGLKSGPGSLGPPPMSFKKTAPQGGRDRDHARARLGFQDDHGDTSAPSGPAKAVSKAFDTSDDEGEQKARDLAEEKAIAKPTLRLINLPPGISPAAIKALIPPILTVEGVKMLPPSSSGGTERKSMAAVVTVSKETPATDIDSTVSSLQNRYLGYGFYLSLHRHLSSAVMSTAAAVALTSGTTATHAFGAKPVPQASENHANPHDRYRGFAPPPSYGPGGGSLQKTILHVPVQPPTDIKQLQLIHKVIESVLEHGPEFEALLMSRPDVQKEEKWAWIWDARSTGGVWYRWRLWEVVSGAQTSHARKGKYVPLFEGCNAWKTPEKPLAYEYTTCIDEFVSDPEYNSSDDDDFDDEAPKPAEGAEDEKAYLNPLDKAKLTHLLARLPTALGKIRKGDVARVTTFALTHASRGADEVVDMIVLNILKPFALTWANPSHKKGDKTEHGEDAERLPASTNDEGVKVGETQDTSAASLVGLYIVSDIISSSATSGIRHAWRFRQLFEGALKERKVFETLGLMAERFQWGRMRAEKWKRSVGLVLSLWEGWCAFSNESQKLFTDTFESPPSAKKEEQADQGLSKSKWKTVEAGSVSTKTDDVAPQSIAAMAKSAHDSGEDGEPMDDVDGEMMDEDMVDVEMDSDIDGVPMDEEEDGEPMDEDGKPPSDPSKQHETPQEATKAFDQHPRRRMRAVDMFADSDDSDKGK